MKNPTSEWIFLVQYKLKKKCPNNTRYPSISSKGSTSVQKGRDIGVKNVALKPRGRSFFTTDKEMRITTRLNTEGNRVPRVTFVTTQLQLGSGVRNLLR